MFRRKSIIILSCVLFVAFLYTTNYLLSVLQLTEIEVKKANSAEIEIFRLVKELPSVFRERSLNHSAGLLVNDKESSIDLFVKYSKHSNLKSQELSLVELWKEANSWVSQSPKTQLIDITSPIMGKVMFGLKNAPIIKADTDARGTQLKILLTLRGNQQVIFKPKWYPVDKVIDGPVYSGKDRYGSEIIAFYLSVLLNKPLTPISTERNISLKLDILPVASKRLLATCFDRNGTTCLYGKCFYCKRQDPICDNHDLMLSGAVIFNIKNTFNSYRSPWQRTYMKRKKAAWEEFPNTYCNTLKKKLPKKRLYDLIDTAIFDFIIQNGDRHHYETFGDTVILLDNGKGLGNPYTHHLDILAPLYQCCMLKQETYNILLSLTGGRLTEKLRLMPDVDHLTTPAHLHAMEERLLIVFAAIQYCKNRNHTD